MTATEPNRFRAALITGASRGIGAAFAALLPPPATLLLTGRSGDDLARLRDGLPEPGRVEILVADLAVAADRTRVAAAAEARQIDLLVNNAGFGIFGPVVDNDPRDEAEMAEVNVVAPVVLTRALASGRRGGVIILSSVVGFGPVPRFATYAATKAFDLHYAEALATELRGAPVDVLALCPGATRTGFQTRAGLPGKSAPITHSAEQVAREGLDALGRRTVHVVGTANHATALGLRLLPRALIRRGVAAVNAQIARRNKRG